MKRSKLVRRIAAIAISAFLCIPAVPNVSAQTLADKLRPDSDYGVKFDYSVNRDYSKALEEYAQKDYATAKAENVNIDNTSALADGNKPAIIADDEYSNAILFGNDVSKIQWTVQVPVSGLYGFTVHWKAADDKTEKIARNILIDGEMPFEECASIEFARMWVDDIEDETEDLTVRPRVKQIIGWQETDIYDYNRMYDTPLQFYLEQGTHTVEFEYISGEMVIGALELDVYQSSPTYSEYIKKHSDKSAGKDRVLFEAESENILFKNNNIIRMENTGDPSVSPYKTGSTIMNIISWSSGGDAVTYEFSVNKSGLYEIALRLKQNFRDGLPSIRRIEIDGAVPFEELANYSIKNDKKWRTETISNIDGKPYSFYLEEGKHTLTLTVAQGDFRNLLTKFDEYTTRISNLTRQIRMIVGSNPDINYDYELQNKIPGLLDEIKSLEDEFESMMQSLSDISDKKVAMYYQLESMIQQLKDMAADPFIIPQRLTDFDEILSTLGTWLNSFAVHPLTLDTIEIYPVGQNATVSNTNIFEKIWVGIVQFITSFTKDYNSINSYLSDEVEITDTLDVWIGRGNTWAELIKRMSDEEFTAKTGIAINMNILPAGQLAAGGTNALMLAIASGNTPDICLSTTAASVGEFALRNALADLTQFSDFEEVKGRFVESLFIPMSIGESVYGLPETMNFSVMMYRKDILSELGLGIPNTWDELYDHIIPVLSQNNMQFYIATGKYDTFLYQMGGQVFTDDLRESALGTPQAYQAFLEYCNLFTLYGVPVSANFYNRFRSGEMPIGIVDFTTYMTVRAAAVELQGRWGVALIPGIEKQNGEIDRSNTGLSAESVIIMEQSKKKQQSWDFLKWWTSAETQSQYGFEIEALMGETSRWNTANTEAFSLMPWDMDDLKVIEQSWDWNREAPVVLGGYFNSRHVTNAFNRVVVSGINVRDSLEQTVKDINAELRRRRKENN